MERLLNYFKPEFYYPELFVMHKRKRLYGSVTIDGEVLSDCVKFHAVNMEIKAVQFRPLSWREDGHANYEFNYLDLAAGEQPNVIRCDFQYDGQVITIPITPAMRQALNKQIAVNKEEDLDERQRASFKIEFESHINTNMQGCYLSTYEWHDETQYIAATQFESHYAREAFPCIDEPAAKACFQLVLLTPDIGPYDVVLANTPLIAKDENRYTFAPTPPMSTYLLAWVIGPFKSVSTVSRYGYKVTSYAALNQPTESLLFANNTAARALDYYDECFQEPYPLPKLDQVALPDFEAGAMENWGLVTYRESMMLADSTATLETKRSVAVTVTHELSHQWFGNLVTMSWWDDLWLNESFATMMEYYCTDALYPEYNIWQDFFTGDCLAALKRDALPGVQAVQQDVRDPAEIATLFDSAIVYAKGARLMLMLCRLMGAKKFFDGLGSYFDEHRYRNTVADDLWDALQPYAQFNVKKFMHAWISQPGYPALQRNGNARVSGSPTSKSSAPTSDSQDSKSSDAWLQQRFLLNGTTDDTKWPLPAVKDDMSGHYLLDLGDQEFHNRLENFSTLDDEHKLRLLIDRTFLAQAQLVSSASLLDLLPRFADESSAPVWSLVSNIIANLKLFCPPDSDAESLYQQYLRRVFHSRLEEIDLAPLVELNDIQVRDALLSLAYYLKDEQNLSALAQLYDSHLERLDPELRSMILLAKYHFEEDKLFAPLLKRYQSETDPEIKSDLLYVLATFSKQSPHLDRMVDLLKEPAIVRPQDHIFLYIYLLRNHRTRARTLRWLTENWNHIEQLTGDKSIEDYPRYAAAQIRTPEEAKIFYTFFDQKADNPILRRTLKVARIDIDARLSLIQHQSASVIDKLKQLTKED